MKDLSDKISSKEGMSSSVKDGTLVIDTLIAGGSFNISDIKLNDTNFSSTKLQEAVKGSGLIWLIVQEMLLKMQLKMQMESFTNYKCIGVWKLRSYWRK